MKDLIFTIEPETRKVIANKNFLGVSGENLQGNIIAGFKDNQFIDGTGYFEVIINENRYFLEMTKDAEAKTYSLPIRSSLLQQSGALICQFVINQAEEAKFKSQKFNIPVLTAINATQSIPEEYQDWVDYVNEAIEQIPNKQDIIDENNKLNADFVDDTNATNKFVSASEKAQITTNAGDISTINSKIPTQASSSNKLADKEFVNSSIATNTANFIGTFASVSALLAYTGTITNNDYAFVANSVITDNGNDWATFADLNAFNKNLVTDFDYAWVINGAKFDLYRFDILTQTWNLKAQNTDKADVTLNKAFNRYKATVSGDPATTTWAYEFTLNNSSFTASQWASINSEITSGEVAKIGTATLSTTAQDLSGAVNELNAGKQNALTAGTNITIANNVISANGLTEVKANDVNSESATQGEVLTADGQGGASWQPAGGGSTNAITLGSETQTFEDNKTFNLNSGKKLRLSTTGDLFYIDLTPRDGTYPTLKLYGYPSKSINLGLSNNGNYIEFNDGNGNETIRLKNIITKTEVPDAPSTDGTYTLKCVVSDNGTTKTYQWVLDN